ncbi:MAG: hypothetical protein JKX87_04715 [Cycloclasticus sp.]|nr:hypothetical protein [Cycloclasticus sp.]
MSSSNIQFHEEKKAVITNILDAAVKTLDFDQKSYMEAKAKLMSIIEKPGYEKLGLAEVVSVTNKVISKVVEHSGYVIVDSSAGATDKVKSIVAEDTLDEKKAARNANTKDLKAKVVPSSVSRSSGVVNDKPRESSVKGKEKLLQLMRLLPPLISREDMERYSAQIKNARLAPATGASSPRTTGDFEKVLVAEVLETYTFEFDDQVKQHPKAFIESMEMTSGRTRKVDISDKLRKQLARVGSVGEFLSIKDLVDRHVKDFTNPKSGKGKGSGLFFWKKK